MFATNITIFSENRVPFCLLSCVGSPRLAAQRHVTLLVDIRVVSADLLWFLYFVYLINNVSTPLQFRSVVLAALLGFIISAGTVVVFFERGIGTDTVAFVGLHDQAPVTGSARPYGAQKGPTPGLGVLTLHSDEQGVGSAFHGNGSEVKRSQGMFRHPGIAAGLCGMVLPVVLAYLLTSRSTRDTSSAYLSLRVRYSCLVAHFLARRFNRLCRWHDRVLRHCRLVALDFTVDV